MKLLGMLGMVVVLALGSSLVGHGARHRVGRCARRLQRVPVQVIRSTRAAQEPKTVRTVPAQ